MTDFLKLYEIAGCKWLDVDVLCKKNDKKP
jgi:hypothetical protein